ncbi:MAG: DUF488 domain-containing protein [Bacilli bacterium]|nr:DUF488 domain-containing protein [Bacilli bacterium]MDD4795050.1 DUF488 domain-containing protein [Bacilli bacterium]
MNPIYTIGHSNRPVDDLIKVLKKNKINLVVDVRSLPGSNKYPQYNKEILSETLDKYNIIYVHLKILGGLRKINKKISPDINGYWENKSFHNYADYTLSDEFDEGLKKLISLSSQYTCVVMCAEALWWRCHRRIITDYLLSRGYKVYHLFDLNNTKEAILNERVVITNGKVTYPSIYIMK